MGALPATTRFLRIVFGIRLSRSALPEGGIKSVACFIRISRQPRTRIDLHEFLFSQNGDYSPEGHCLEY